jgi:D-sedoheptulose 7-phosphate isomerase
LGGREVRPGDEFWFNGEDVAMQNAGGGDEKKNISANLVRALEYAREVHATICGVVGRDGGYTAQVADACVLIPVVNSSTITPHTESFQVLIGIFSFPTLGYGWPK